MRHSRRSHSGKGILIAVVLGPLCAAAVDLPGRAVAAPAEPVASLGIQMFEHAKVAPGDIAAVSKVRSVRKQQNSYRSLLARLDSRQSGLTFPVLTARLYEGTRHSVRLHWLENPTSTGP